MTTNPQRPDPTDAIRKAIYAALRRSAFAKASVWTTNAEGEPDISPPFYDLFDGMYVDDIRKVWQELYRQGEIYEPKPGLWKAVHEAAKL